MSISNTQVKISTGLSLLIFKHVLTQKMFQGMNDMKQMI